MKKILILGKGRIGKAVEFYLKKYNLPLRVEFFSRERDIKKAFLLVSALPGSAGEKGLKLALKYRKDLIDISDLDYRFYIRNKKAIFERGIRVFPECGFSPGLTNLICGREAKDNRVKEIEILAGSLSKENFSFPFLWCFEDLIETHQVKATLIKKGRKIKTPPFSDYRKEKIEGVETESYLAEGLESLLENLKVKNMSYRVIRPFGFFIFFKYLENHGFFKRKNLDISREILESKKQDNLTIGQIRIKKKNQKIVWKMKSFSKKNEKLNSMQKITAVFPVVLVKLLLEKKFIDKGVLFPEKLGEDEKLFKKILSEIRKEILISKFYIR